MNARISWLCATPTSCHRAAAFPADLAPEPNGLEAVRATALGRGRIDEVWISPALAAVQTAEALGLAGRIDSAIRDLDCGRWAGRRLDDVATLEPEALASWLTDPASRPHGGESIAELVARVTLRLGDPPRGRVLAISHASVIRAAILCAIAAPMASFWRIDVAPLSWTVLSHNRGWRLHAGPSVGGCP